MMTPEKYWETLAPEQRGAIQAAFTYADEQGLDVVIQDSVDLWYLLPESLRGEMPS